MENHKLDRSAINNKKAAQEELALPGPAPTTVEALARRLALVEAALGIGRASTATGGGEL